ncbi:MAG: heme A synthase [Planctomycetota bacterium]|nr:MAG: heme A synthase [Planctomycetota bacterium]
MTQPHPTPSATEDLSPLHRSLVSWMGVLFGMIVLLIAVGGFVRLTGSGLSIPEWPFINGSLLPPMSAEGWVVLKEEFERDQERLQAAIAAGAVGMGSLGRIPEDMADFKVMFYIEWSHRALASIIGLIAIACLIVAMRHKVLWARGGQLLSTIVILIIGQAILGGLLVKSGTSTQFLFLHLGTAAIILSLVVWTLLRLLQPAQEPKVETATAYARRGSRRWLVLAMGITWIQLVFGALVAGSRAGAAVVSDWPLMNGVLVPNLWNDRFGLWWNLLDNAILLQWVHRWFAWVVVAVIAIAFIAVVRSPAGIRQRMAAHLVMGLLATQMILGVMNVFAGGVNTFIALAHLVTGMLLLVSLVAVYHDARHEQPAPLGETTPAVNRLRAAERA